MKYNKYSIEKKIKLLIIQLKHSIESFIKKQHIYITVFFCLILRESIHDLKNLIESNNNNTK